MIRIAYNTLERIDYNIHKDQGRSYRTNLRNAILNVTDAYRTSDSPFRAHLGASQIGIECERKLWIDFRWVVKPEFDGRILRLFNRGHLEEARFIAALQSAEIETMTHDPLSNRQFKISDCGGHFGGSCDAILVNVPEVPNKRILGEFKTHNRASFAKLKNHGVVESKPEHVAQVNIYMYKLELTSCLYLAVNKDTDELYGEILDVDPDSAESLLNKGDLLIRTPAPPLRITNNPKDYRCKMCPGFKFCHMNANPHKSCRTCVFASPIADGLWKCRRKKIKLTPELQYLACPQYIMIDVNA